MYYVKINVDVESEQFLYYPSDNDYQIYEPVLSQTINECGEFTFKIPKSNPSYDYIKPFRTIKIYRNDKEYWGGFIKSINTDFYNNMEVYCVEDLSFLSMEFPEPKQKIATKRELANYLIQEYNKIPLVVNDGMRSFDMGFTSIDDATDDYTLNIEYGMTYLDCLRLVAGSQGIVKIRRRDGRRHLDIVRLMSYGDQIQDPIVLGENLLDYASEVDTSEMCNVIKPYGNELEEEYVFDEYSKRYEGDEYMDFDSVMKYGAVKKIVIFDEGDEPEKDDKKRKAKLKNKCIEFMKGKTIPQFTINLTAVDMSELSSDYQNIRIGDIVRIIAEPYGLDGQNANSIYPIVELNTNLQDVSQSNLVLSQTLSSFKTLTKIQGSIEKDLDDMDVPEESAILKQARENAKKLLDNAEGGYISYEFNDKDQMIAQHIADNLDFNLATKEWVWNKGGLGYRERTAVGEGAKWEDVKVAMTSDGAIVADMITAGKLSGDRIGGGELKVGGTGYGKNGSIVVRNKNNQPLITLDENGIKLTNGQTLEWTDIKDRPKALSDFPDYKNIVVDDDVKNTYIGMTPLYYMALASASKPAAPKSKVRTTDATMPNKWTTVIPKYTKGYVYWTCSQYQKFDSSFEWSGVSEYVPNSVVTKITQDTITTGYVNALKVTAATISAIILQGKRLESPSEPSKQYIDFRNKTSGDILHVAGKLENQGYISRIDHAGRLYSTRLVAGKGDTDGENIYTRFDSENMSIANKATRYDISLQGLAEYLLKVCPSIVRKNTASSTSSIDDE